MTDRQFGKDWTKQHAIKSALLFFLNFLIFTLIALLLSSGGTLSQIGEAIKTQGANYLYALFCVFLLFVITYFYFLFEDRSILRSGKQIALVFTILDFYLVLSCLIGYKIDIYARPVALVALLIFVLIGRRNATAYASPTVR